MTSINRSRSSNLLSACQSEHGARSRGERVQPICCPRALHACGCGLRTKHAEYWFSTLPKTMCFHRLVDLAKLRWRIDRGYQELKQKFGSGIMRGRGWRGFYHHATLCIVSLRRRPPS